MKNVQISYELFVKLLLYHLAEDYDDTEEIAKGLQDKLDSMIRHQHYTEYKTAETEEEKQWLEKQNFKNTADDAYTG